MNIHIIKLLYLLYSINNLMNYLKILKMKVKNKIIKQNIKIIKNYSKCKSYIQQ